MPLAKLKQAYGNSVTGEHFWGRDEEIALFLERIDAGAHQLLVAQRRMGKTSLMRETAARLTQADTYICLFVDLQKAKTSADAVVELSLATRPYKPLWSKTTDAFKNVLGKLIDTLDKVDIGELGITLRAGLSSGNWAEKGNQLLDILAGAEKPVLLLLDEVPVFINRLLKGSDSEYRITAERREQADEFMSWLRANSLKHQGKIRMVISGSIGLEPVLRQAGLSATINNFVPFELRPWDRATAAGCLEALANEKGLVYGPEAIDGILNRLGVFIPHHVQMFFDYLYQHCRRKKSLAFHAYEVDDVYNKEMLSIRGHAELTHYEERLKMVLGQESYTMAVDMLSECALTARLTREALIRFQSLYEFPDRSVPDVQKEILWVLEHDGYIVPDSTGYRFVSPILRDWWRKRYENMYIPVSERKV